MVVGEKIDFSIKRPLKSMISEAFSTQYQNRTGTSFDTRV